MTNVAGSDGWSKQLFGNRHALRVAAAIAAASGEVDSRALQVELSIGQTSVHRVLTVLEAVRLLERVERTSQTEPQRYRRAPHSFWAAAQELMEASNA